MRLRKPSAVIFDLDGILLDTEPLYTEAATCITRAYGKDYTWELKSRSMGTDPKNGARLVIEALALPISVDEWLEQRRRLLERLFLDVRAMRGAVEFVAELQERGVPTAIATSSERALCQIKWSKHPWVQQFQSVICGDDRGIGRLKPAPDIYLFAAQELGQQPEACLVFEDSPAGVTAAKAAGMQVVCVRDERLDLALVSAADLVVESYAEVSLAACGFD